MSRFADHVRARLRGRRGPTAVGILWHVACMGFVPGCLYIAPAWRPEVNQAPQVTVPANSGEQLQLKIISDRATLVVAANDPESEIVSFIWQVPHGVEWESTEWQNDNGDYVSTLTVTRDEVLHESTISCTLSDQAKPRNVVALEWFVEVQ